MTTIEYEYKNLKGNIRPTTLRSDVDPKQWFASKGIKEWWEIIPATPTSTVRLPSPKIDPYTIPKKTLNVSKVEGVIDPDRDTSLLKLTKKGSTKLYVSICIILGIIILAEGKVVKKIIK